MCVGTWVSLDVEGWEESSLHVCLTLLTQHWDDWARTPHPLSDCGFQTPHRFQLLCTPSASRPSVIVQSCRRLTLLRLLVFPDKDGPWPNRSGCTVTAAAWRNVRRLCSTLKSWEVLHLKNKNNQKSSLVYLHFSQCFPRFSSGDPLYLWSVPNTILMAQEWSIEHSFRNTGFSYHPDLKE
jgi:hypothetical protein